MVTQAQRVFTKAAQEYNCTHLQAELRLTSCPCYGECSPPDLLSLDLFCQALQLWLGLLLLEWASAAVSSALLLARGLSLLLSPRSCLGGLWSPALWCLGCSCLLVSIPRLVFAVCVWCRACPATGHRRNAAHPGEELI